MVECLVDERVERLGVQWAVLKAVQTVAEKDVQLADWMDYKLAEKKAVLKASLKAYYSVDRWVD